MLRRVSQSPRVNQSATWEAQRSVGYFPKVQWGDGFGLFTPWYKPWFMDLREAYANSLQRTGMRCVRFGDNLMGPRPREDLYRVRRVIDYDGKKPTIGDNCFLAPTCMVIGDVTVGRKSTVGYNAVVRGDKEDGGIILGESSNVQDKAIVHGTVTVGKWTSIEPMAIVEDAIIGSCSFIGGKSIIMRGCTIESNAMVCAAAVLRSGSYVRSGEIWAGNPAHKIGDLTEGEKEYIIKAAKHMVLVGIEHQQAWLQSWEEIENQRISRELWSEYNSHGIAVRTRPMYVRDGPEVARAPGKISPMKGNEGSMPAGRLTTTLSGNSTQ